MRLPILLTSARWQQVLLRVQGVRPGSIQLSTAEHSAVSIHFGCHLSSVTLFTTWQCVAGRWWTTGFGAKVLGYIACHDKEVRRGHKGTTWLMVELPIDQASPQTTLEVDQHGHRLLWEKKRLKHVETLSFLRKQKTNNKNKNKTNTPPDVIKQQRPKKSQNRPSSPYGTETWTPSDRCVPLQSMQTKTPRLTAAFWNW